MRSMVANSKSKGWCMFATQFIFDTKFKFGTNCQLFNLMDCAEHKLARTEHTFGSEHIVPTFNGVEVKIPHYQCKFK